MRIQVLMVGAVAVGSMLVSTAASARTNVFVHGRNSGYADTTDYWHVNGSGDGVAGFTGGGQRGNWVYAYDATQSWSDLSADNMPVCQLADNIYAEPDADVVLLTHSAGGNVAAYFLAVAHNGWATSCAHQPNTQSSYVTYFIPVAAPFRGSELADRVYGHTGGNFLQQICGSVAGALANLLFNQASNMTWALQTSMVQNNYGSLTAYGGFSAIYQQWGTSTAGDDSTAMSTAIACGFMPSPNDGVVAQYSASYGIPGGHQGWHDSVGHSSNRRNDYRSFATNVWNNNPY